jgi:hypothetical protein
MRQRCYGAHNGRRQGEGKQGAVGGCEIGSGRCGDGKATGLGYRGAAAAS